MHSESDYLNADLSEHLTVMSGMYPLLPDLVRAAQLVASCLGSGGKLMLCGNGGSAADCQHLAAEFVGRFLHARKALSALALTTDSSALTCIGNDYGFGAVFERQVQGLGRAGDVLVGMSTSGDSENVVRALAAARSMGMFTVGFLGRGGGACLPLCNIALVVPSESTARIQEAHGFLGHVLCTEVETLLQVAGE